MSTVQVGGIGDGSALMFWFGENPGKISWNLGKICENLWKISENLGELHRNMSKNGTQNHIKSGPKIFQAIFGKFEQTSFAPPKFACSYTYGSGGQKIFSDGLETVRIKIFITAL